MSGQFLTQNPNMLSVGQNTFKATIHNTNSNSQCSVLSISNWWEIMPSGIEQSFLGSITKISGWFPRSIYSMCTEWLNCCQWIYKQCFISEIPEVSWSIFFKSACKNMGSLEWLYKTKVLEISLWLQDCQHIGKTTNTKWMKRQTGSCGKDYPRNLSCPSQVAP